MAERGFRKFIITFTVITASLLELIDTTIVNVALPDIMGNLGATLAEVSWVVTGYVVANVIVVPMTGWFSARFGRKHYFAVSILIFVAASALCGQATGIWELVIFRAIQGIGGGALLATSQSILVETFPPEELGLANALFGLGAVVGPTIGPTLGGWLTDHFSWPWVFYVNVPVGLLAFFLTMIYIDNPDYEHTTKKVDWWGIGLLITGVGALQVVLERGESEDWFATTYIVILTVLAIVGLVGFVWRELTAENPIVDLKVLKYRNLALGSFFVFILGFGLYGSVFVFPVFTQNLLGLSALDTGLILLPGGIATMFMMPIIGVSLKRRVPPQYIAIAGMVIFFIFSVMLSHETLSSGMGDFFWPLILRGIGLGCLFVPLTTIALSGLKGKDIAQGAGLTNMIRQLGGSFGVALIATFIDRRNAYHRSVLVEHISQYNAVARQHIQQFTDFFTASGSASMEAQAKAYKVMDLTVMKQMYLMSYTDAFYIVGIFFLLCIPLLFLTKHNKGGGSAAPVH
ncbi:MAG TPA: DHA2 family efflux MFS transporter permease subunit [Balneolaceae bacterium]|nr:DHA2 family efflux MFS transporter permease subunit [Balneolaceae bacterium]